MSAEERIANMGNAEDLGNEQFRKFCSDLWKHIQHAKNKHPNPYELPSNEGYEEAKARCEDDEIITPLDEVFDDNARFFRGQICEAKPDFDNVIQSEYYEMLAEVVRRDRKRTYEESLDVCAVIYRMNEQIEMDGGQ